MKKSFGAGTLAFPTPVWLIGAYDKDGKPNVMTAAWGGICCSTPPCMTVSLQKPRYTFDAILAHGGYTISVPSERYVKEADFAGIVSGRNVDKFAAMGLTPVAAEFVDAPYVSEFPMVIECKLVKTVELGVHTQFIGEIMDVKVDEACLTADGKADMAKVRPILFGPGARSYHGVGEFLGQAFSIGKELKEGI
jgi:flavin reductase (DIM6/NTAB) family NADH-FMN oxidoreductase RutF